MGPDAARDRRDHRHYLQQLLLGVGITLPTALSAAPPIGVINVLAVLVVLVIMSLLVIGIRESARANDVMVIRRVAAWICFPIGRHTKHPARSWPAIERRHR